MPVNRRHDFPQPDKDEKTHDRMMLERLLFPKLIWT